jgi:homoserine kinase
MKPDYGLIARSLHDVVAEPIRSVLIPRFDAIKEVAISTGALGCGISGSGPTIFALSTDREVAHAVAKKIQAEFETLELKSDVFVSRINQEGAKIVD